MAEVDEELEIESPAPSMLPNYRSDVRDMVEGTVPSYREDERVVDEGEELRYVLGLRVLYVSFAGVLMQR